MKGSEFLRGVERVAREREVSVRFYPRRGKGSHGTLYYGEKCTVVRNLKDELKSGTLHAMLKQLGLTLSDIGQ